MKKNSAQQKADKPASTAAEYLKYEVGQEMGIKNKKNQAEQGTGIKPRWP